ncbi:MAG: hypothetical protein Q8N63_01130, partial [Nanoarchaeota archaeon]|nr:hypothetical protein [Nanoarchaeota archaeon]
MFVLSAPTLETPANNSDAYSLPVVLSWSAPSVPQGYNLSYYVYGDAVDGSTYLGSTTDAFYLWRNLESGIYYWKIKASTGDQNSSYTETRQFNLDLCTPDTDYSYALNYPMSYNNNTDTITIWGSNGTDGKTAMGNSSSNPITFEHIYRFGKAKRGICAVTKPAEGSYAILTNLYIGNITSALNITYVKTTGESVDFSKQVKLNANARLISGLLTSEGNPYAGSTLSFAGTSGINPEEGLLYTLPQSYLEFYDSSVKHKTSPNQSALEPWSLYWNGYATIKSSNFQKWWTIRFLSQNNSLNDVTFTDIGQGFYPAISQVGTINLIKSRKVIEEGVYFVNNVDVTIDNLQISEVSGSNIRVLNYTGTANLLNPILNWSSINWTTGSFSGSINRKYTYDLTAADATGTALANASIKLIDVKGNVLFNLASDSQGKIPQQTITRAIFDYNYKTGNDQGPHRLYIKKYGKSFMQVVKEFSAASIETLQLTSNPFSTSGRTEAQAKNFSGIYYNAPAKV